MSPKLEIKVAATTDCNNLAKSIVAAFREGKDITLACIGPQPVCQAVKAIVVANRALRSSGVILFPLLALVNRMLPDAEKQREVPWVVTTMWLRNLALSASKEDLDYGFQASARRTSLPDSR